MSFCNPTDERMSQSGSGRLTGKTAVITGSTRGIGESIAKRFAEEGASVTVTGRTVEQGERVCSEIRGEGHEAQFIPVNVRNTDELTSLFDEVSTKYDCIDILVNNAAIQTETSVQNASLDDWNRIIETDFRAYWLCAKLAIKHMDTGSIINISSNHAFQTMPAHFPYNAVKAGINGMTRALALDLGPQIRVNTINPGWIAVDRTMEDMSEENRKKLASIHPAGRIGLPADVAGAAVFLASDDAIS